MGVVYRRFVVGGWRLVVGGLVGWWLVVGSWWFATPRLYVALAWRRIT
jgi:hypothetical protein